MKDHILQLHPHDDFASARDKIGWAQAERVVLVWPAANASRRGRGGRGRPLTGRLDLVLLHRHADRLGARLGFVTDDPEVADLAADLGIPVFPSIEASHLEHWAYRRPARLPPRPEPKPDLIPPDSDVPAFAWPEWIYFFARLEPVARALVFVVALTAAVALGVFVLPSATITLTPASEAVRAPLQIVADPAHPQPDLVNRIIPARVVEIRARTSVSALTSGLQEQPSTRATGAVVFTNRRAGPINIPRGTVVRTTGGTTVRFATTQLAVTPAEQGGSVTVPVEALNPGPPGNVAAESINAMDGAIAFDLFVVNPQPTSGGAVLSVATVTEADQDALREDALAQLREQALIAMQGQIGVNEFLAPDTLRVVGAPQETFSHFVGEKADTLTLDAQATLTATAVNERGAQTVAFQALNEAVAPGAALIEASETYSRQTTLESDPSGRVTFSVVAAGRQARVIDAAEVRRLVGGQELPAAIARLQRDYNLAAPPSITFWPEWLGRLPWFGARIQVQVVTR